MFFKEEAGGADLDLVALPDLLSLHPDVVDPGPGLASEVLDEDTLFFGLDPGVVLGDDRVIDLEGAIGAPAEKDLPAGELDAGPRPPALDHDQMGRTVAGFFFLAPVKIHVLDREGDSDPPPLEHLVDLGEDPASYLLDLLIVGQPVAKFVVDAVFVVVGEVNIRCRVVEDPLLGAGRFQEGLADQAGGV